jgi:glycosyltransferase involved in cell wall biosynthesis
VTTSSIALCIPAYNAGPYLGRLLESARHQDESFDEILVYDDCSTDDTTSVAVSYGATVVAGDVNRGCSFAKNRLAEVATTEWVHFHDADDELRPNFVSVAREYMESSQPPDVVLFAYEYRDDSTGELLGIRRFEDAELRRDAVGYSIREQINPFCGLYRRRLFLDVGGYDLDPEVLYNEDVAFHCKLARAGLRFAADDRVTVINYRRTTSMSQANRAACARAHLEVMRRAAEQSGARYHALVAEKLWVNAGIAAMSDDWSTAKQSVALAEELGTRAPRDGSSLFRMLARVSPVGAVYAREWAIRALKPSLRR